MPNAFSYSYRNIYNNDTRIEVAQYCQYKLTMTDGYNGHPRAGALAFTSNVWQIPRDDMPDDC